MLCVTSQTSSTPLCCCTHHALRHLTNQFHSPMLLYPSCFASPHKPVPLPYVAVPIMLCVTSHTSSTPLCCCTHHALRHLTYQFHSPMLLYPSCFASPHIPVPLPYVAVPIMLCVTSHTSS